MNRFRHVLYDNSLLGLSNFFGPFETVRPTTKKNHLRHMQKMILFGLVQFGI